MQRFRVHQLVTIFLPKLIDDLHINLTIPRQQDICRRKNLLSIYKYNSNTNTPALFAHEIRYTKEVWL